MQVLVQVQGQVFLSPSRISLPQVKQGFFLKPLAFLFVPPQHGQQESLIAELLIQAPIQGVYKQQSELV